MLGNLKRLFSCPKGNYNLLEGRDLSLICLLCTDFFSSSRFPGFIFPCLGVHPVQEVSPEEQRGASLQVGPSLKGRLTQIIRLLRKNQHI